MNEVNIVDFLFLYCRLTLLMLLNMMLMFDQPNKRSFFQVLAIRKKKKQERANERRRHKGPNMKGKKQAGKNICTHRYWYQVPAVPCH
jgi:hypothetical protein